MVEQPAGPPVPGLAGEPFLAADIGGTHARVGLVHIRDFLVRSAFVERFLDRGRMRAFLERAPVRLMEHGQHGVIGAAGWYLDQGRSITQASTKAAASKPGPATASDGDRRK